MVLIILSFLGAALLIGLLVYLSVIGGGFIADVWYSYVILGVIAVALIVYAFWKMEDEYFVFTNARQKREARCKKSQDNGVKGIKYRRPYTVEGADENYIEFEEVKFLLRNHIDGEDRYVRFNKLVEGGYTPAMALYGYYKLTGLYGYKVDEEKGWYWLRAAEKKKCPVAYAYLYYAYRYEQNEKKALSYLKKALNIEHIIPIAYIAQGDECMREKNVEEAKLWYEKAIAKNPNYGYYELAESYKADKSISDVLSLELQLSYLEKAVSANFVLREIGLKYYGKGDEKLFFRYASAAANAGDIEAMADMGYAYRDGEGVKKNYEKAFEWFSLSAERGSARGQFGVGYCYEKGIGVARNPAEAVNWYRKSAEQGDPAAQCNLGYLYGEGIGLAKNPFEAVKWYRKSAEQGDSQAQHNLGVCYEQGNGVLKNLAEAVKWYSMAAEQGKADSQYNLGRCYEKGIGVERNYTRAVKWYRKSAEQGNAMSEGALGYCYERGYGVAMDKVEAVNWYHKAAKKGDAGAQDRLGYCYVKGIGVAMDKVEAAKWFRKSAEQGNENAQYNLGVCYENGDGVERDRAEARKWYQKAAAQGNKCAKEALQQMQ